MFLRYPLFKGDPYPKHKVDRSSEDLPTTGEPNPSVDKLNPDGSIKQRRYYGPDRKAQEDIDYNHGGPKHTTKCCWNKNCFFICIGSRCRKISFFKMD
jgi:hypothetical protein